MSLDAEKRRGLDRGAFYRTCRELHGYISAIAFAALLFFSVTGITLNHPEWFENDKAQSSTSTIDLRPDEVQGAKPDALAKLIEQRADLRGTFSSGEVLDGEVLLRFEGPKGNSDVAIDQQTGRAEIRVENASAFSLLNDLHRGKNAGPAWKAAIDIVAGLVLALSAIGFVLFLSLRFRLGVSLALTTAGLAGFVCAIIAFVA
jgi:uncharacterized protein